DLFGFELLDGHLYLHIDLGSGYLKKRVSKYRIDNSTWHDIALSRIDRRGKITVDEELSEFETIGKY
ncbi:GSCOCG00012160001-RA-CDS, partial [Cotesia congregata]